MISIIVTTYNLEKYIEICLKSLLCQTYENIEIICIDDGSTDNTAEIIKNIKDSRIKYYYHENRGVGFSRNKGLELATGEYVMFVDGDDWVDKTLCEKTIEIAQKCNSDIVIFDVACIDNVTKIINNQNFFNIEHWRNHKNRYSIHTYKDNLKIYDGNISSANKLFKREFLLKNKLKFNEALRFEDFLFHYQTLVLAQKINLLQDKLYYYRVNREGSMITSQAKQTKVVFDIVEIFQLLETFLKEHKLYDNLRFDFYKQKLIMYKLIFFNSNKKFRKAFFEIARREIKDFNISFNEQELLGKQLEIYEDFLIYNSTSCYIIYSLQKTYPRLTNIINVIKQAFYKGENE